MSRKNIYQIISENKLDPTKAFEDIKYYLFFKKYRDNNYYDITVGLFIDKYVFSNMPIRESFINLLDLIKGAGIINIEEKYERDYDDIFTLSEIILCAIDNSPERLFGKAGIVQAGFYSDIIYVINSIIKRAGHKIVETPQGRIIITEDAVRDQAISVSQDDEMSLALLEYTHYANSGNIEMKASILTKLGRIIEPRLENPSQKSTADIISYLLNSFHLRHNNQSGKWTKEYLKGMEDSEREKWLDMLYNSIVYLIIEDEQKAVNAQVSRFRKTNK